MERPFSSPSPSDHQSPFTLPFAPVSMAPTAPGPTHANVFLHFSVSNSFWLAGNGGTAPSGVTSFEDSSFAPPQDASMAAPPFCFSSGASVSCSQKNAPSGVDLVRSSHTPSLPVIGQTNISEISCITGAPASSAVTSADFKGRHSHASSGVRLRILDPQQKRPAQTNDPPISCTARVPQNGRTSSLDFEVVDHSGAHSSSDALSGQSLPLRWNGLKKSRSKRRRFRTWGVHPYSPDQQESAIQKSSSWCSNEDSIVQKGSSSSIDSASCCIHTEVSTDHKIGSVARNGASDPDWADRISWNRQADLTCKLDQLAFVACELKAKRRRSPTSNRMRRHHYTTETFSPLSLITSYWQQKRFAPCNQVAGNPNTDSLSFARDQREMPIPSYMRRQAKEVNSRKVSAPPLNCTVDRAANDFSSKQRIKKPKTFGRQTRVQRCARQVLDFVGKDIIREKLIRQALGNNPDTSKALRLLLDQRKLGRIGGGGRRDPYKYKLTPNGLDELDEKKDGFSYTLLVSSPAVL